ncbi:MAG: flagellar brake protein [Gallionella sp.]|nr:flagellar brake protein [Gallionella sp.]
MPDTSEQSVRMELEALRLYPGAAMYIQSQSDGSHTRHKVQFIGTIKGKSLLVTLPFENGKGMWIQAGHTFVVRGFNGIYAYALSTQVIRARAHPYAYIHFSWPRAVDCQMVRKSLRVETSLPARVTLADNSKVNVTLLDLSAPGSMLATPAAIGAVGEHARIEFTVDYEGEAHVLNIPFIIRNIHPKEDGSGFRVGVGFESLAQNDALILHYVINTIALSANL